MKPKFRFSPVKRILIQETYCFLNKDSFNSTSLTVVVKDLQYNVENM